MSSVKELENYVHILQLGKYSWTDLHRFCQLVKTGNHRYSGLVVIYGSELLDKYFNRLETQEAWDLVEQVFISALDSGEHVMANKYLKWMDNKFPNSNRVSRLKGMQAEALGNYASATAEYEKILKSDPGNSSTLKRRIAIEIAQGNKKKAISMLNEFLEIYMDDSEAWLELANIYLKEQSYEYAAFCFEELILLDPHNYHFYVKYAEIKYTMGDYQLALKYYALAIDLCKEESNLSSFYGIIMACHKIGKLSKEEKEVHDWAQSQIFNIYKKDDKLHIVQSSIGHVVQKAPKEVPQSIDEQTQEEQPKPQQPQQPKNNPKKSPRRKTKK